MKLVYETTDIRPARLSSVHETPDKIPTRLSSVYETPCGLLLTIIVTWFNSENLWTFKCANEGVLEQVCNFYAYNSVVRNDTVGIVPTLRARRSVDRNSLGGATFPEHFQSSRRPPNLLYNGYRVSFRV